MIPTELNRVIREYLLDLRGVIFTGDIEVQPLDPEGYCVYFYYENQPNPFYTIAADLPDDKFLIYLKEQIRKLEIHKYFKLKKLYCE